MRRLKKKIAIILFLLTIILIIAIWTIQTNKIFKKQCPSENCIEWYADPIIYLIGFEEYSNNPTCEKAEYMNVGDGDIGYLCYTCTKYKEGN